MAVYAQRSNVYATGLGPETFRRPPRDVEAVAPSSGTLTLRSHGLAVDAPVSLAVLSSSVLGAPPAAVPAGLAVSTPYYWQPLSSDLGQLATAPGGGSTIASFSDAGSGVFGVLVDHGPYLDEALVAASAVIDQYARAHKAPITADALPFVCAYLAARIYIAAHAPGNPAYAAAAEPPSWLRGIVDTLFRIWLTGAPVLGAVDATPDVADNGARLVPTHRGPFRAPVEPFGVQGPLGVFTGARLGPRRDRV